MKISIVTAAYNSSATIADTLRSIAEQTYQPIEHIIVDGLSKDNTLEIVKGFPHVAIVISEKDKGLYDAMNKGIAHATGQVVGILNSDDIYNHSGIINKVMEVFSQTEIDAVYGDLQYVAQHNTNKVIRKWKAGSFRASRFYYGWMPPHPTFFVKKELYDRFGMFNLSFKTAADYELMLRFLLKNKVKVAYIPEVLVKMRMGGASNSSIINRIKANREDRQAWKINNLQPNWLTLAFKPLRKVHQFFFIR